MTENQEDVTIVTYDNRSRDMQIWFFGFFCGALAMFLYWVVLA